MRDFGENKVQEAEAKVAALADLRAAGPALAPGRPPPGEQGEEARPPLFDCVHSVDDDAGWASGWSGRRRRRGSSCRCLVQVDLAAEETKFGLDEARLFPVLESLRGLQAPCTSTG